MTLLSQGMMRFVISRTLAKTIMAAEKPVMEPFLIRQRLFCQNLVLFKGAN